MKTRLAVADTSFFQYFSFPLIRGSLINALVKENCILLSETTARKYFGTVDPIGKTLIFNDSMNFEITGVYRDIPDHSHIHFDLLVRFETIYKNNSWGQWNYFTYILTNPATDPWYLREKQFNGQKETVLIN